MLLNLKQLSAGHAHDEKTMEFDQLLDLSAVKLWGSHPFSKPVKITGTVKRRAGVFTICYLADFEMQGVCSRCLVPLKRRFNREFVHTVLVEFEGEESSDSFVLAENGELDLDGLVISDLLPEYSGIMLCGESCKGLCPSCGRNLNDGNCGCNLSVPDPRFQVLRDFLNGSESGNE